jgi:hypothetical protein
MRERIFILGGVLEQRERAASVECMCGDRTFYPLGAMDMPGPGTVFLSQNWNGNYDDISRSDLWRGWLPRG